MMISTVYTNINKSNNKNSKGVRTYKFLAPHNNLDFHFHFAGDGGRVDDEN